MPSSKCPGPDGIQPIIYKHFWEELGTKIHDFISRVFATGLIPHVINTTYLSLIPKIPHPTCISDFRPIGLCNTIYKLITKIIASRLKPYMSSLISPLQTSFVPGRSIEENVIIIKEVAHIFNKAKRGKNIMALKIDLTKAFDSLKWGFIHDTLTDFGFPSLTIKLIMSCVSSSTISCLWNGEVTDSFQPTRGIRQGTLFPHISLSFALSVFPNSSKLPLQIRTGSL